MEKKGSWLPHAKQVHGTKKRMTLDAGSLEGQNRTVFLTAVTYEKGLFCDSASHIVCYWVNTLSVSDETSRCSRRPL